MRTIDFGGRRLADGVLASPAGETVRILLWVPRDDDQGRRSWDRVGVAAGESGRISSGIRIVPASAYLVEARASGGLIGAIRSLTGVGADSTWALPDGTPVERRGGRRADLALAWREEGPALDEAEALGMWPHSRVRRIGDGLFLVEGPTSLGRAAGTAGTPPSAIDPAPAAPGGTGGLRAGAVAAVDQGVADLNRGDAEAAVDRLRRAALVFQDLGEPSREADALYNLGLALLGLGRRGEASTTLAEAARLARGSGDVHSLKLTLEATALMLAGSGDAAGALGALDEALEATRAVGDRHHEARLLWSRGVVFSDLDRRDLALRDAEASNSLMMALGRPEAAWYEDHLRRYHDESAQSVSSMPFAGMERARSSTPGPPGGPGLLRMAFTATKAMASFVGSGFETTPEELRRARLTACRDCEHHTGLRCRVCGCFTEAKSRMAHERCPLGKWPA